MVVLFVDRAERVEMDSVPRGLRAPIASNGSITFRSGLDTLTKYALTILFLLCDLSKYT